MWQSGWCSALHAETSTLTAAIFRSVPLETFLPAQFWFLFSSA